ncbi:transmembrane domain-containing protein [Plectosphaerella plurivora]|uniref:Transmembrane domain-containing protein n=1 Tax=Plectosphaerella plurivora TaxID=936078 RepID=A0A9P9A7S7_9PEZI|nr:transmembrane domain-containing protein [Plectosphaerella plurivora]
MVSLQDFLPEGQGILPYYMALLSLISIGNSAQTFTTLHFTRRVYDGLFVPNTTLPAKTATKDPADSTKSLVPATSAASASIAKDQVTPLAARLFGTWTLIASLVRMYAAYNLKYGHMYDLAIWTYIIALGHFSSEMFIYKSMTFGKPQAGPFIFATVALVWMPLVRSYYVQFP